MTKLLVFAGSTRQHSYNRRLAQVAAGMAREAGADVTLLELSDFEVAEDVDPGTEQLAVNAKFEAELIISFRDSNPKLAIRKLAAAFAAWLRLRKWTNPADPSRKLPTAPARVVGAYADDFSARREQFEVFRVEWQQVIHLGNTVWTNEGQTPSDVSSAFAPDIGSGNEDAYDKVSP